MVEFKVRVEIQVESANDNREFFRDISLPFPPFPVLVIHKAAKDSRGEETGHLNIQVPPVEAPIWDDDRRMFRVVLPSEFSRDIEAREEALRTQGFHRFPEDGAPVWGARGSA